MYRKHSIKIVIIVILFSSLSWRLTIYYSIVESLRHAAINQIKHENNKNTAYQDEDRYR